MRRKINPDPQSIDEHNWFYDGNKFFTFIHEVYDGNRLIQIDEFKVNIEQLADFIANLT
jgi:hypothetical protein